MVSSSLAMSLFQITAFLGRRFKMSHPRISNYLARTAFKYPEFSWHRDRWGNELYLSPYYWQDRSIIVTGMYDSKLNLLIEQRVNPGMVCMDIGANIGHITLHLARRVGQLGKVYAFEPVPQICNCLRLNVAQNRLDCIVSVEEIALSHLNGIMTMGYADSQKENQGMGSLVNIHNEVATLTMEVRTQTLDDFMIDRNLARLDFLKVDIQGSEIFFLEGAMQTLAHLAPDICMEISPSDLACLKKKPADLLAILQRCQYQVFEIEQDGSIGPEIDIRDVTTDFSRGNIFCKKKR